MLRSIEDNLQRFARFFIPFTVSFLFVRLFEYLRLAPKVFVKSVHIYEITGLVYDVWFCLIYGFLLFVLFLLIRRISVKAANITVHFFNVLILCFYLSLIITYAERNTPLDHELIARSFKESFDTTKQMASSGVSVFIPFVIYIGLYFILNKFVFRKINFKRSLVLALFLLMLLGSASFHFANAKKNNFENSTAYY